MATEFSKIYSNLKARSMDKPMQLKPQQVGDAALRALHEIGIRISPNIVQDAVKAIYAGDAALQSLGMTQPSVPTPLQFLQSWLPGFVNNLTAKRNIDEILGVATLGEWRDEEIVQGIAELTGNSQEYGDFTNIPLTSWNVNFARRTIVRGEEGIQVGVLSEERAAAMRASDSEMKRNAAAISLEQRRNSIGFFGYFNGKNRTYGFLNDPNLPAFVQVAGGTWASKGMEGICADLRQGFRTIRTQALGNLDVAKIPVTIVIPTDRVEDMTVFNTFGITALDWLKTNYPNARLVEAPEMMIGDQAQVGDLQHCFYIFAEEIPSEVDGSTDGGQTFMQLVQTKFMTVGVEKRAKGYVESYSNATAGVLCKRPYAVYRAFGI
jgi:hypothetical protein